MNSQQMLALSWQLCGDKTVGIFLPAKFIAKAADLTENDLNFWRKCHENSLPEHLIVDLYPPQHVIVQLALQVEASPCTSDPCIGSSLCCVAGKWHLNTRKVRRETSLPCYLK